MGQAQRPCIAAPPAWLHGRRTAPPCARRRPATLLNDTDRIALIKPGMTQDDVQQALGRPARTQHYSLSQSTPWTYDADPLAAKQVIFDVDFDAQGRVATSGERRLPSP